MSNTVEVGLFKKNSDIMEYLCVYIYIHTCYGDSERESEREAEGELNIGATIQVRQNL